MEALPPRLVYVDKKHFLKYFKHYDRLEVKILLIMILSIFLQISIQFFKKMNWFLMLLKHRIFYWWLYFDNQNWKKKIVWSFDVVFPNIQNLKMYQDILMVLPELFKKIY